MDIVGIVEDLKNTLAADAGLNAFLMSAFNGKRLTIVSAAQDRTKIPVEKFPCALAVTGDTVPKETPGSELRVTNIHLLVGIKEEDRAKAHDNLLRFYELAVEASQKDITRGGRAINTSFVSQQTDFGVKHPVNFRLVTLAVTEDIIR